MIVRFSVEMTVADVGLDGCYIKPFLPTSRIRALIDDTLKKMVFFLFVGKYFHLRLTNNYAIEMWTF